MRAIVAYRIRSQALVWPFVVLLLMLPAAASAAPFDALVVFGDSLSDNGNLFALTGGAVPPNPPYFNGRFSNGPVWNEYLASSLGLPLSNFAYGGALTGNGNFLGPFPGVLDEIARFAALHPAGADPHSLYVIWAGANDFFAAPAPGTILPAVTNVATAVGTLVGLGATHILVSDMPDLGKTPDGLGSGFSAQLTALSLAFNGALDSTLSGLGLPGLIEFDVLGVMDRIIANPAAFGFTDVTTPCFNQQTFSVCANPDQFLFWDAVHPTTRGQSLLAAEFERAVPAPASLVLLGAGLTAACLATRRRRPAR